MKNNFCLILALVALVGCKSNPHKAEQIETKMEQSTVISGGEEVGLKNGEMVVMSKVEMAEKLRDLHNTVYAMGRRVWAHADG